MAVSTGEDLVFEGPAALAQRVRAKEIHPRELVELCLRRIEALNPKLNAFRVTMADEAMAAAENVSDGPLAGVPVAIKDEMRVTGQTLNHGARTTEELPTADSELVRRLRAAGAIPIGITNVPELTIWPWTASAAQGITRNPWDPSRTTGGSSGGSAAAVASGMVPAATAADGGGSIRIPASCCGLVGMKPTRGRVSLMPLPDDWLALAVYGALARTVRDSAALMDVMHGPVEGDKDRAPEFTGSYADAAAQPPRRLRIAMSRKIPPGLLGKVSADQRAAWERTAHALEALGHDVTERDPAYGLAQLDFLQMWSRGVYETSLRFPDRSQFEPSTRQLAAFGQRLVPPRRRRALLAKRERTTARILALWDEFDVLLTPGLAKTPIAAEGGFGKSMPLAIDIAGRFTPFTPLFNLTGQPAVSLPAGTSPDGLPLSVQLVGRHGAEDLLYSLAGEIETAQPWVQNRPPIS
jgi:amidase